MFNWKKKIDKLKAKERLEQQQAEEAREKAEKAPGFERLSKFKCHICGIQAQRPSQMSAGMSGDYSLNIVADWDIPGDLFFCTICNELTCEEHLYKGICKSCAEKL